MSKNVIWAKSIFQKRKAKTKLPLFYMMWCGSKSSKESKAYKKMIFRLMFALYTCRYPCQFSMWAILILIFLTGGNLLSLTFYHTYYMMMGKIKYKMLIFSVYNACPNIFTIYGQLSWIKRTIHFHREIITIRFCQPEDISDFRQNHGLSYKIEICSYF